MINIHYCKSGKAIGDFSIVEFVEELKKFIEDETGIYEFWFSTVNIIEEIRAQVAEGKILPENVGIFYGVGYSDKREINEYGKLSSWEGMTIGSDTAERTLIAMMKKYKERKNAKKDL